MPSFLQLMYIMRQQNLAEGHEAGRGDTPAMVAIRTGMNLSETFWDDFMGVCNNAENLADLLGVQPEEIGAWRSRIEAHLKKVEDADSQPGGGEDTENKMLPTGVPG